MTEDMMPSKIQDEAPSEEDEDLYAVISSGTRRQSDEGEDSDAPYHKIDFLYDVPLKLSVEIGQTTLSVREILGLKVGRNIEFTKVVGEPMDITISGRLMARGEIVVVNERYGVRISEVTRPDETGPTISSDG